MVDDEDTLLEWLIRRGPIAGRAERGDDAAKLSLSGDWAFTIDTQAIGRHLPADTDAATFARRLLAVNLSDLAASGAEPKFALLALAAPATFPHRVFFRALDRAARAAGVQLVGGDLSAARRPRAALLAAGRRPDEGRWLSRGNARPGDTVWLAGTLGESAAGQHLLAGGVRLRAGRLVLPGRWSALRPVAAEARRALRRHLAPRPQIELGLALGRLPRAAAIDLSDGFALDLDRLCRRSGVGARIDAARLPVPPSLSRLSTGAGAARPPIRRLADAEALALGGGEDYILLFTLPRGQLPDAGFPRLPYRSIGEITAGRRVLIEAPDGSTRRLPAAGFRHWAGR